MQPSMPREACNAVHVPELRVQFQTQSNRAQDTGRCGGGVQCLCREVAIQHVNPGRVHTDPGRPPREVGINSTGCGVTSSQCSVLYRAQVQSINLNHHICHACKPIANNAHISRRQFNTPIKRHVVVYEGCCTSCATPSAGDSQSPRPVADRRGPPCQACLQLGAGIPPAVTLLVAMQRPPEQRWTASASVNPKGEGRARFLPAGAEAERSLPERGRLAEGAGARALSERRVCSPLRFEGAAASEAARPDAGPAAMPASEARACRLASVSVACCTSSCRSVHSRSLGCDPQMRRRDGRSAVRNTKICSGTSTAR